MKRLHVHVSVDDLDRSIAFYSTLFASEPSVRKPDYVKWMLDDPRVNFAISARGAAHVGLDHLGIQVEDEAELKEVYGRLQDADGPMLEEGAVTCCYHQSEKSWITDPTGIAWETFLTRGESTVYGDGGIRSVVPTVHDDRANSCCGEAPTAQTAPAACCTPAVTAQ